MPYLDAVSLYRISLPYLDIVFRYRISISYLDTVFRYRISMPYFDIVSRCRISILYLEFVSRYRNSISHLDTVSRCRISISCLDIVSRYRILEPQFRANQEIFVILAWNLSRGKKILFPGYLELAGEIPWCPRLFLHQCSPRFWPNSTITAPRLNFQNFYHLSN